MLMGERNSGCSTEHVDITDYRCLFCTGVECSSADTYRHSANSVRRDKEFSSAMRDNASAYTSAMICQAHGLYTVMSCKLEQSLCTIA